MSEGKALVRRLVAAGRETRARLVAGLPEAEARALDEDWPAWVHFGQEAPGGDAWRVWVMLAGRGFGKTRAGAEWVHQLARAHPGAAIALVAATPDEARAVMVEGRSGLLATARARERGAMRWEPSRRRLTFASGATAFLFSGAQADKLRGPEHHFAWCDELAKWRQAQAAWDNLLLGLRLGERPRALVTTTPRAAALRAIVADPATAKSGGASWDNPHVSAAAVADLRRRHEGTRFGRQELEGVLLDEVEGALWRRETIEACRVDGDSYFPHGGARRSSAAGESNCPLPLRRVAVGVDPPASHEGVCGIVVCGVDREGVGYVLADLSVGGVSPEGWARKAAAAAEAWGASRVVAEANNGGRMVEAVLKGAGVAVPVRLVHAAEGKAARAAPVAALFESGRAKLAGRFPALEDELAGLSWGGDYAGPGRSPDRADAMVWAMTELMLGREPAEPRIRLL